MNRGEWLAARETQVTYTAMPGRIESEWQANEVAAIEVTSLDGYGIVIEGRPEDLVALAQRITDAAARIVVETMRDPQLRALYGMT